MPLNKDFQVEYIESITNNMVEIDGRLVKGNISIGEQFNFMSIYCFENNIKKEKKRINIKLELTKIICYGISLTKIEEGLTARLKLNVIDLDKEEFIFNLKQSNLISILGNGTD